MTHAAVFDSLVVHNEEGDHTKQKCNAIVCSGRTKSQHTAQVAKQNKQENRTNIVDKPSCIAAQNTASHIGKGFIGHLQRILEPVSYTHLDVNKEAESILETARRKAKAREEEMLEEARTEAARIIERANREIELEKKKAVDDMKQEVVNLSLIHILNSACRVLLLQDSLFCWLSGHQPFR